MDVKGGARPLRFIIGGGTAHSLFKIPVNDEEHPTCNVKHKSMRASLLRLADVIIWDEMPMMHRKNVEAVHRLLCDLHVRVILISLNVSIENRYLSMQYTYVLQML